MTGRTVRWGVLGPGGIAERFAAAMQRVADGEIVAVASRTRRRARAYARRHGIARAHVGRDALLADADVDAVYVATPHSCHADDTIAALAAGKHVLCEKPFALDAEQARRMAAAAQAADRFCMEAIWSRFLPAYRRMRELVDGGAIGRPLVVEADFGFRMRFDPSHRLFDPARGGGALLDVGIYPVQLCIDVLGVPDAVAAQGVLGPTGVDEIVAAVLHHPGGGIGVAKAATRATLANTARITGTEGWIELPAPMHCPTGLTVQRGDEREVIELPWSGDGLRFEIEEVHRCLAAGARESATMPVATSIALMEVLDEARRQLGVTYPTG